MASLTFEHVKKSYHSQLTVKDFNLDVKDKELLVLVGCQDAENQQRCGWWLD